MINRLEIGTRRFKRTMRNYFADTEWFIYRLATTGKKSEGFSEALISIMVSRNIRRNYRYIAKFANAYLSLSKDQKRMIGIQDDRIADYEDTLKEIVKGLKNDKKV